MNYQTLFSSPSSSSAAHAKKTFFRNSVLGLTKSILLGGTQASSSASNNDPQEETLSETASSIVYPETMGTSAYLRQKSAAREFSGLRSDDVVLVTGGCGGLGRELCREFKDRGVARVLSLDVVQPTDSLRVPGVEYFVCDVSDMAQVQRVAREISGCNEDGSMAEGTSARTPGASPVTVLVNNAGIMRGKPLLELTEEDFAKTIGVNLVACFNTLRTFVPGMLAAKRGYIVTIASVLGHLSPAHLSAYGASKAGLIAMHEAFTAELENMELDGKINSYSSDKPQTEDSWASPLQYLAGRILTSHPQSLLHVRTRSQAVARGADLYVKRAWSRIRSDKKVAPVVSFVTEIRSAIQTRPPRQKCIKTLLVCPGQIGTAMFEGVETPSRVLAPVLKPESVACAVARRAAQGRGGGLYMPFYARFVPLLKSMPVEVVKRARWVSGMDRAVK